MSHHSLESGISGQPEGDFRVSFYSVESGISTCTVKYDIRVSHYSVESGISGQSEADFRVSFYSVESGISTCTVK